MYFTRTFPCAESFSVGGSSTVLRQRILFARWSSSTASFICCSSSQWMVTSKSLSYMCAFPSSPNVTSNSPIF
nr:MAG TPA: hypothetical protein [Caudoviricetes sp.]